MAAAAIHSSSVDFPEPFSPTKKVTAATLGAATYIAVLGAALKATGRFGAAPARLPLWMFLVAGAAGGLASALARPQFDLTVTAASVMLAPATLASFHWFSLRTWSRVRSRRAPSRTHSQSGE
ncbi:MAG: hypothetical protein HY700_20995 [Gemmatimonadetes bacterium]|nr:hypothetical protein [Gemmatimonadota bacterium]